MGEDPEAVPAATPRPLIGVQAWIVGSSPTMTSWEVYASAIRVPPTEAAMAHGRQRLSLPPSHRHRRIKPDDDEAGTCALLLSASRQLKQQWQALPPPAIPPRLSHRHRRA